MAVFPIAAAVEWKGDHPTGVAIELWTALAERIGVDYDFVRMGSFKQTIDCLTGGEADVALGLAITEEREQLIDLTHPLVHSGLRIAVRQRESATFLQAVRGICCSCSGLCCCWHSPPAICSGGLNAATIRSRFRRDRFHGRRRRLR